MVEPDRTGHRRRVRNVVFTGAAGPCIAPIVEAVLQSSLTTRVTVLAPRAMTIPDVDVRPVDLTRVDFESILAGADAVIHLGGAVDAQDPYELAAGRLVAEARAVLDATQAASIPRVIVVSSAIVLGALATNPVPLTEQAVVHPEPGFRPAVEMAEIERIVAERRGGTTSITVLRAAPVVADGAPGWLAEELHRSLAYPVDDADPGLQYLHVQDLASAIVTVLDAGPDDVVHVAPDGALTGGQRRALEVRPGIRVPDRVARATASMRSALRGTATAESIRPYLAQEWSLANDRLRSLGWEPTRTNEQAYVAAFQAAPWSMIPSGRRQELLLGAVGAVGAAVTIGIGVALRRRNR